MLLVGGWAPWSLSDRASVLRTFDIITRRDSGIPPPADPCNELANMVESGARALACFIVTRPAGGAALAGLNASSRGV